MGRPLPVLLSPEPWESQARCAQVDPELWFPEQGKSSAAARRICADCPVKAHCERQAAELNESYGIWGGKTAKQRQAGRRVGGAQ